MDLGRRAEEALLFIAGYHADHQYPPTVREICHALCLSSKSVAHYHLERLRRLDLVRWKAGKARTLVATERGMRIVGLFVEGD